MVGLLSAVHYRLRRLRLKSTLSHPSFSSLLCPVLSPRVFTFSPASPALLLPMQGEPANSPHYLRPLQQNYVARWPVCAPMGDEEGYYRATAILYKYTPTPAQISPRTATATVIHITFVTPPSALVCTR